MYVDQAHQLRGGEEHIGDGRKCNVAFLLFRPCVMVPAALQDGPREVNGVRCTPEDEKKESVLHALEDHE